MAKLRTRLTKVTLREIPTFLLGDLSVRVQVKSSEKRGGGHRSDTIILFGVMVDLLPSRDKLFRGMSHRKPAIAQARNRKMRRQLWEDLLLNLARDLVPYRPNRTEPHTVKRRPKPYPLLNKPRRKFKEIAHRNRYWKNNPRKTRS